MIEIMISEKFLYLGALLNLAGSASYIIATLKGQAKPDRITWLLWATTPFLAFSAQVKSGVGLLALATFMSGFCPLLVVLASFVGKNAAWKISKLDILCGSLSALGLVLWMSTGSGNLAIIFAILAGGLAGVPTIVKSYYHPESESWHAFFTGGIVGIVALLPTKTWDFAHVGFSFYIVAICSLLVLLVRFKIGTRFKLATERITIDDTRA